MESLGVDAFYFINSFGEWQQHFLDKNQIAGNRPAEK